MKKKTIPMLLAALLAVVLIFSLAACGGSAADSGDGSDTKSASGSGSSDDAANGEEENGTDAEAAGDEYLLLKFTYTNSTASNFCLIYEYTYMSGEDGLPQMKYYLEEINDDSQGYSLKSIFLGVYTYDDSGRATGMTAYGSVDSEQVTYEYDESGNMISETAESYETLYEYDEDGNQILMSYYVSGSIIYSYEYDQDGNIIRYLSYGSDGECSSVIEYEYNEEGETVAQVITYEEDDTTEQGEYRYTYDEDGNRTAGTLYFDDILIEEYEYDEAGNVTNIIRYDSSGEVIYQYEYVYVSAEDYFAEQKDASFVSREELAEYVAEAIYNLDGEGILENLYDGVLPALRMSTRYSLEELAETLNEVFEDNFDDALEDADWEGCEMSWEIEDTQVCPTEDYEMLMDELQYPQFDQEDTYKMDLVLTVTTETGETGEVLYVIYLVEEDGQWYIWMLDDGQAGSSSSDTSSDTAG